MNTGVAGVDHENRAGNSRKAGLDRDQVDHVSEGEDVLPRRVFLEIGCQLAGEIIGRVGKLRRREYPHEHAMRILPAFLDQAADRVAGGVRPAGTP
jgi:hypothetical protein